MNTLPMRTTIFGSTILAASLTFTAPVSAVAGGSGTHEHHEHKTASTTKEQGAHGHHQHNLEWGEPGQADQVNRTIEVIMGDIYFEPESIQANEGDMIRFVIKNVGNLIHEFNIGTPHMHQEHQQEMITMLQTGMMTMTSINHEKMEHSDMKHDDANSVLLEPGKNAELIWRFAQPKDLEFACNVPGHYEAGMVGVIKIDEAISRAPSSGDLASARSM